MTTRTTLILEKACMEAVRRLAQRESRTISEVVNELLSEGLQRRRSRRVPAISLPSYSMGRPTVNLADRNALESMMDS